MRANRLRICITACPFGKAFIIPLSNLEKILYSLSDTIYIVTGGVEHVEDDMITATRKGTPVYKMECKNTTGTFGKIVRYIFLQTKVSLKLIELSRKVDVYLFFGAGLLLPILTARLLRKNVVTALAGAVGLKTDLVQKGLYPKVVAFQSRNSYKLSNRIIVYSENIIEGWNLQKYQKKISVARHHFLDFDNFKAQKHLNERDNLVGYIGRLSQEKGILNFTEAIPRVRETRGEATFLIGGDGPLRPQVEEYANRLNNRVKFVGWVPHDELPEYLNKLELLVLPSYTEGLPNIMLEAMACGTPVLAAPVGAIPGIIKDGETGFIMENNSPECIAKNIVRALDHPNLEQIAGNARILVEREFTFEKAAEGYRRILNREP
jgi:glycosyltransferase involved in cell wall biosynthesis